MAEILSRKKKVMQQEGPLHLVQETRIVQYGYKNYGEDFAHYLARKNQKGELEQDGQEYGSLEDARKAFSERTRQVAHESKAADAEKPESEKPAPEAQKVIPEKPKKAPEQSTDEIMKDWPTAVPAQASRQEFPRIKPPKTLLGHPRNGKPMVLDHGDNITVTRRAMLGIGKRAQEKREHAITTGLQAAAERFGQPVHFEGSPAFLKETAEMAVKLGISLEPGSKLAEHYYQQALEQKAKEKQVEKDKGNFFAQSVEKQKERKLDVGKGLER